MEPGLTLVLGGIRSGKSAFAETLVNGRTAPHNPVFYLATGRATDSEMAERIRLHQERRPAHWQTVEESMTPAATLAGVTADKGAPYCLLVDSVDTWVANLLLAHEGEPSSDIESRLLAELDLLLKICRQDESQSILVSSEVGLSPVAPNRLGRQFQDLLGTVNQRIAAAADEVYLVAAGISLRIKPQ